MQYYILDMLHNFWMIYDNYQYILACLGLWHVFILSLIFTHPQSLLSYSGLFLVLCMRVWRLNCRIFSAFIYMNITIPWPLFIFRCAQSILFSLNIIHTQSLFIFVFTCSCFVVLFQFIILYCFVDVSNFFVDLSNFFVDEKISISTNRLDRANST